MANEKNDVMWSESSTEAPAFSTSELAQVAASVQSPPSLLDGISQPFDLELIKSRIFASVLPDLCMLAHRLGYGWVLGVNGTLVGEDYIYVSTGQVVDIGSGYKLTGPGFRPNMDQTPNSPGVNNGTASAYGADRRTSIEFVDVRLSFGEVQYANARWLSQAPTTLATFKVENGLSSNVVSTDFSIEYYSDGQAGISASKNWSNSWDWSVSSSQTLNLGVLKAMFPSFSVTANEQRAESKSSGGSQSTSTSVTQGARQKIVFSHATPAGHKGVYSVTALEGKASMDFTATVTLEFGVKFHGFLRWGGGVRFQGDTNYHNAYSGSGERPNFDFTLGGNGTAFWTALSSASSQNADPWNWTGMFHQFPSEKQRCEKLILDAKGRCSFPVAGAVCSISRRDIGFVVLTEEPVV